jgi:hypothetical protein
VARDEYVGLEAGRAKTHFRARQLKRVDIEPDHAAARPHTIQNGSRMTAPAERAIHGDLAGARAKAAQNLVHHDRDMRAGRRLSGREHFCHVPGIPLWIQFFVFVVKFARALACVTPPSHVHRRQVEGPLGHAVFYSGPTRLNDHETLGVCAARPRASVT